MYEAQFHYQVASDGLPSAGFLRLPQVLSLIPVSRAAWWSGIKSGIYPQGVKLSANTTAWRVGDIRALIARLNDDGNTEKAA